MPRRRSQCLNQLVPLVEGELRRIAHFYMRMEPHGHTLQTSALINEAYLKLVNQAQTYWQNRAQFLGVAARLMRHTRPLRSCARCIPERREMRPAELRIPRISGRLRPPCGVQFLVVRAVNQERGRAALTGIGANDSLSAKSPQNPRMRGSGR